MFDGALEKRYLTCSHDGPRTMLRLCPPPFAPPRIGMMVAIYWEKTPPEVFRLFVFHRRDVMHKESGKL